MAQLSPTLRKTLKFCRRCMHLSIVFNLGAIICILLLMSAGTWIGGGDHPSAMNLNYEELALVHFDGPVYESYERYYGKFVSRSYWFLNSFGWTLRWNDTRVGAGYVYRRPAQALQFPQVFQALNHTMFAGEHPVLESCGLNCSLSIPGWAFGTENVQTAHMFTFYLLALLLSFGMIFLEVGALHQDPVRKARWRMRMALATAVCHLIAASLTTAQALKLWADLSPLDYHIGDLGDPIVDPVMGSWTMYVIWCGLLGNLLAWICMAIRGCIDRPRLNERSAGQEMVVVSEPQGHHGNEPPADYASEVLPEYTVQDMESGRGKGLHEGEAAAPPYEEHVMRCASSSRLH